MHFETLWEQAETKFVNDKSSLNEIISSLLIKINLYLSINEKMKALPEEELSKIKTHLMGEILLTLTHLSCKENINVFAALDASLNFDKILTLEKKYENHSSE